MPLLRSRALKIYLILSTLILLTLAFIPHHYFHPTPTWQKVPHYNPENNGFVLSLPRDPNEALTLKSRIISCNTTDGYSYLLLNDPQLGNIVTASTSPQLSTLIQNRQIAAHTTITVQFQPFLPKPKELIPIITQFDANALYQITSLTIHRNTP